MIITMRHVRANRDIMCVDGVKDFCARQGLDWKQVIKHGIDSDVLLQSGDAMAIRFANRCLNELRRK